MAQEQKVSQEIKKKDTPLSGGWTDMQAVSKVDPETVKKLQGYLEQVREAAQVKGGRTFDVLEPLEFATQVVSGTNYRIKAHTGGGRNALFVLYQPISSETVSLTSFTEEQMTQTTAK